MQRAGGPAQGAVLDIDTWAQEALSRLVDLPGVRRVGLALTEGGGRRHRFTASDRDDAAGTVWCHVDAYEDIPLNEAVRTGRPVVGLLEELADRYTAFVSRQQGSGVRAIGALPLIAAGQVLGGFVLFFEEPQAFGSSQRAALRSLGHELGGALRRVLRDQVHPLEGLIGQPAPDTALAADCEVPHHPASVGEAREFLRSTLERWDLDEATVDVAVLCLSELVTNVVMHTHSPAHVRVVLDRGVLTTTVRDGGRAPQLSPRSEDDPLVVHGRGLQLVEILASRWGSEQDGVGTTVWFELEP